MNIFYVWERTTYGWTKNCLIKDHQVYRFVELYCYENQCEVYFHKDYSHLFQEAFRNFCSPQLNFKSDEDMVNFIKKEIDRFLDKIPKLLPFI